MLGYTEEDVYKMTREDMIVLLEEAISKADEAINSIEEIRAYLVNQGD